MKKNKFYFGALLGLVAPLVSWFLFLGELIGTQKSLAFFAIAGLVNLLLMRYFYQFNLSKSAEGVITSTFIALLILLFLGNFI